MSDLRRVGDLDIDQDLAHARNAWRFQRIGWGVMLLLIVATLAGLFGSGPLASTELRAADLHLEYDRIARHGAITTLRFEVQPTPGDSAVDVWIHRSFLEHQAIEGILPEPERIATSGDTLWYSFAASGNPTTTGVTFTLRPQRMGQAHARAGTRRGTTVDVSQFVLP